MTIGSVANSESPQDSARIVRAINAVYNSAGLRPSTRTKTNRLRLQKVAYLLRKLGYPAAQPFKFEIHLNGPYSPELTKTLIDMGDEGFSRAGVATDISPRVLNVTSEALQKGPAFLEGLTTVLDGLPRLGSVEKSLAWARSIKPHLDSAVWQEVTAFLAREKALTRYT